MYLLIYTFIISFGIEAINYIGGYGKGQLDPVLTNVKKLLEDKTLDVISNGQSHHYTTFIPDLSYKLNYNMDPISNINFNTIIIRDFKTFD